MRAFVVGLLIIVAVFFPGGKAKAQGQNLYKSPDRINIEILAGYVNREDGKFFPSKYVPLGKIPAANITTRNSSGHVSLPTTLIIYETEGKRRILHKETLRYLEPGEQVEKVMAFEDVEGGRFGFGVVAGSKGREGEAQAVFVFK